MMTLVSLMPVNSRAAAESSSDWREDYAYSMGVAAMHYAYPYLRMAEVRHRWTMTDVEHPEVQPNHALNTFWHATRLTDATWKEGGAPNNDTLYSGAWLKVDKEPMILSLPPINRYYTFEMSGFNSDNFAYVSELQHGRKGGHYALLPQGWEGDLPAGVEALTEVPSPWVMIVGRTYVADESDLPVVRKLQEQYRWTPLSQWGQARVKPSQPEVFTPYSPKDDPMAVWKTINRAMTENPPIGAEKQMTAFFREVNIGQGLDVATLDEASKRGLARAAKEGLEQIRRAQMAGAGSSLLKSNGWIYSTQLGHAGVEGDFLLRTLHQSYAGIVANDAVEAIYYGGFTGGDGQPLNGAKHYRIYMPEGTEPDVGAFWSISLYGPDNNFVANEINRYSIGDRTPNLARDEDGGLTIVLQTERPTDPGVNWLPAPEGAFWLVLRAYQPGPSLLEGSWQPPSVTVEQ
jgi:hypothetical protein